MHNRKRVLVVGHNNVLVDTRTMILETSGFQAWKANTPEQAADTLVSQQIDAMILCQTLSEQERDDAIATGKRLRPQMKVLVMRDEYVCTPTHHPVEVLETLASPLTLIAAVKRITAAPSLTLAQN